MHEPPVRGAQVPSDPEMMLKMVKMMMRMMMMTTIEKSMNSNNKIKGKERETGGTKEGTNKFL